MARRKVEEYLHGADGTGKEGLSSRWWENAEGVLIDLMGGEDGSGRDYGDMEIGLSWSLVRSRGALVESMGGG